MTETTKEFNNHALANFLQEADRAAGLVASRRRDQDRLRNCVLSEMGDILHILGRLPAHSDKRLFFIRDSMRTGNGIDAASGPEMDYELYYRPAAPESPATPDLLLRFSLAEDGTTVKTQITHYPTLEQGRRIPSEGDDALAKKPRTGITTNFDLVRHELVQGLADFAPDRIQEICDIIRPPQTATISATTSPQIKLKP